MNLAGHARWRESVISTVFSIPKQRPRTIIVGAGVVGLGIAWRLAQAGCAVTVYDRGIAGRGASWAAAGMLAAGVEVEPGEERLYSLTRASQELWPAFAREVEDAGGIGVGYRDEGTLVAASTRDEVEQLRFSYDLQRGLGIELSWLSGAATREREPHLKPGIIAGVYSPKDHQVDNRLLTAALREAFLRAGGHLHEHTKVAGLDVEAGRVVGLRLGDMRHRAETVVLAAGPWSRELDGVPAAARPPVRPLKGQMLALRMDAAAPLIRHVLWAPRIYMVPRGDGRLILGATTEERGFDDTMTAGGVLALLEAAWRAVPAIEELPIHEMWAGFRPGSRDDAPILGPGPCPGLVYATGHHRNGILLTPVTADLMARYVVTGDLDPLLVPFGLDRFARPERGRAVGGVT